MYQGQGLQRQMAVIENMDQRGHDRHGREQENSAQGQIEFSLYETRGKLAFGTDVAAEPMGKVRLDTSGFAASRLPDAKCENCSVLSGTTSGPTGIFVERVKMPVGVVKPNVSKSYELPPAGFGPVTYGLGTFHFGIFRERKACAKSLCAKDLRRINPLCIRAVSYCCVRQIGGKWEPTSATCTLRRGP